VARDGFDGRNHLFVGHFFGCADKAGVAPIHEKDAATFGIPTQRANELPPFRVVQGTEVHNRSPFQQEM
jgi:hypothetical protein